MFAISPCETLKRGLGSTTLYRHPQSQDSRKSLLLIAVCTVDEESPTSQERWDFSPLSHDSSLPWKGASLGMTYLEFCSLPWEPECGHFISLPANSSSPARCQGSLHLNKNIRFMPPAPPAAEWSEGYFDAKAKHQAKRFSERSGRWASRLSEGCLLFSTVENASPEIGLEQRGCGGFVLDSL